MNEIPRLPAPDVPLISGPSREKPPAKAPRRLFLGVFVLLAAVIAWGAFNHWRRDQSAAESQQEKANFRPTVSFAIADRRDQPIKLTLPGTTLPFDEARIFARATGYIAERRVDIGDRVHQGDLLARIAAPDLDAQLSQAIAQLGQTQAALNQANANVDQARANVSLADVTNFRTATLAHQGWETKQNADNTSANVSTTKANLESALAGVKVAEANLKAQLASVQRLQELTSFERVTAPMDGVITARAIDQGDLVTADAGSGTALFTVQHDDVIRVQSYVPQSGAVGIEPGVKVRATVPEMPDHTFTGQVARSAAALDPSSRTLLVQADIDNPDHLLHSGLYIDVTFEIPRTRVDVVVPSDAVQFNADGVYVMVIGDGNRGHIQPVTIYRDFGTSVQLASGLRGGERVALRPQVDLRDGQEVTLAADQNGSDKAH
ncbi:MAG: efflux RND transporter periplasmic adaptor subunit [Acetobacteraceae bacterium]|nr:efflux RND transporter periplasmic adaptor subunit [Acetobacteraceae bacterium]